MRLVQRSRPLRPDVELGLAHSIQLLAWRYVTGRSIRERWCFSYWSFCMTAWLPSSCLKGQITADQRTCLKFLWQSFSSILSRVFRFRRLQPRGCRIDGPETCSIGYRNTLDSVLAHERGWPWPTTIMLVAALGRRHVYSNQRCGLAAWVSISVSPPGRYAVRASRVGGPPQTGCLSHASRLRREVPGCGGQVAPSPIQNRRRRGRG